MIKSTEIRYIFNKITKKVIALVNIEYSHYDKSKYKFDVNLVNEQFIQIKIMTGFGKNIESSMNSIIERVKSLDMYINTELDYY